MADFTERSTRTYRTKQLFTKEELESIESLCVHEQPPFCSAACPMKLDVRAFAALAAEGRFAEAREMLERITPFPRILASACDAPCEKACRLGEAGEALNISALERAVMRHGEARKGRGLLKFKKKKTAAVFGASLFTLAVAGELAGKSYPLKFFVREQNAVELIGLLAPFLGAEDVRYEAERLSAMDMQIEYSSPLSPEFVSKKRGEYDIVCALPELTQSAVDPMTLVNEEGVISRDPSAEQSVLSSFFDARRAGVSADRIAQGMDPAVMRGEEGTLKSRLYTNMQDVLPTERIPENDGYSPEQAKEEAARCIQCACVECLKGCAYLRHFDKFPRILTREIYNNAGIIMGDHMMNKAMNACALCGQCSITCTNGYDMADICKRARENMVDTGKLSLAVHEFALYDMLFSNGEAFLSKKAPGLDKCKHVFFPGCQAGAAAPETVFRAYQDLSARLPGGVSLMLGCCGAVAEWAGRKSMFDEQAYFLRGELAKLGDPVIIAGCPSCKKTLSKICDNEIIGVWDALLEIGLPQCERSFTGSAVMHDACGARGDAQTQNAVRALASQLGVKLIDTEFSLDKTGCCGYGGLVSYANREVAGELARECLKEAPDAPYISYCMACRDRLAREGAQSMHLLELIYGSPAGEPGDISERRKNRLLLKQRLLREVWKEDVLEKTHDFSLNITPEARALMDERMILESDVRAVMEAYRENGEAILDDESGLLITRHRIGNVTFWVKFEPNENGYTVKRAYSHRMTIETR